MIRRLKEFIKKNFSDFAYFYHYLGYRIFISFTLSFLVGLLDGFGLTMFIPLLKMSASNPTEAVDTDLGNLSFLPEFLGNFGIELNMVNALIIILLFFILKGVVMFIEGYVSVTYNQLFIVKIRVSNVNLLNSFKFSSFVKSDVGRIQNTLSGEVERVNTAYRSYFKTIQSGILVLVYVLFAFGANAQFAIIVAIGGVLSNFLFKTFFKKTKKHSQVLTRVGHSFQNLLIQHVATYKYLKATGYNKVYGNKLKGTIDEYMDRHKKIGVLGASLRALREPVTITVVVIAILIQITYFGAEISLLILSLVFLYRALTYLMALQEEYNKFLGVSGSMQNISEFTNELKSNKDKNGSVNFNHFKDKIILDRISFSYGNTKVLRDVSLEINKNETIAIIGESGSGKSTLINILSGLLLPDAGNIKIDDNDLNELDLYSFRKRIGYIAQEAPVFNDTIYNNVTFWAPKNAENLEKFDKALEKAAVKKFVYSLPGKEDEFLGNNGINISGGQKQRLSIARELYKDVDFLYMDEATSALDGETEAEIQSNIDELKGTYTILIIAHRLATIKNADKIVLLKKGEIEAIGNFRELLDSSPLFRKMIALQNMEA